LKKFNSVLKVVNEQTVNVCGECVNVRYGKLKRQLKRIGKKLYLLSLDSKLNSLKACIVESHGSDNRKRAVDYWNDLLKALKKLPKKKTVC